MSQQSFQEINQLIEIYKQLKFIFDHSEIKGMGVLSEYVDASLMHIKLMLLTELDQSTGLSLILGLRQGLLELPGMVISASPAEGPAYVHAIEYHLGMKFSDFGELLTA